MFLSLGRRLTAATRLSPYTNVLGVARSLVALAGLVTLGVNSPATLFPALDGTSPGLAPHCGGTAAVSLFCVAPTPGWGRAIALAILAPAVAGWRPRWVCVPHWYVAFSLQASATVVDGGDQIAGLLTLLLIPVLLGDGRRWHWQDPPELPPGQVRGRPYAVRATAVAFLLIIQVQTAVIYFNAGVAKLGVREWADGTALYYWLTDPTYGANPWQQWLLRPILTHALPVTLLTWSALFGEIVFALGILLPWSYRRPILAGAVLFHVGIALLMGLVSFALTMLALDIVTYRCVHEPFRRPGWRPPGKDAPDRAGPDRDALDRTTEPPASEPAAPQPAVLGAHQQ